MKTIDIIFLVLAAIGIIQGFMLIAALLQRSLRRKTNYYLVAAIFFIIYLVIEFVLLRRTFLSDIPFFYSSRYGVWLLIGPLLYIYTRSVTDQHPEGRSRFLHFLPFLIFTVLIPLLFGAYLIHKHSVTYGMLTLLMRDFKYVSGFNYFYSYLFIAQFIHAAVYLSLSLKIIKSHTSQLKQAYSNLEVINLNWLKLLISSFIVLISICILFFIIIINGSYYERWMDYIYLLPMIIIIYLIAYKSLQQPQLFAQNEADLNGKKYKDSKLSPEQSLQYKSILENYMSEHKPQRNSELKLSELAESTGIPVRHLSQVLNEQFKQNFYDFINNYRIRDAKELMKSKTGMNILEIAYQVGFNNKTSFNNYFKKISEITPKEYRASLGN
ncbi:MAG: AraC family transcriptional regulator [Calditrichaeota bacterium]|nr:AraC family transcriptional regulator [Calditrichota bacterium]